MAPPHIWESKASLSTIYSPEYLDLLILSLCQTLKKENWLFVNYCQILKLDIHGKTAPIFDKAPTNVNVAQAEVLVSF